ncbi:MAG TPA: PorV/PorQ family protein [Flavobacteriaceae bacterium]|nr:PorV/PorQ family protein [Flavobacteriaceae bacterium]HPF12421.1 PorV/PorQ family protein [Flavobacteriaceae bacterium]HQU21605.1 PorV/PorQ family protein [Flavobacteriaceae bacterium]HQU66144.1 PorV/PorQ family protein [Flavobacteriaceae bacterium]HRW45744.1 PorV/PorQ family protein [Flavobacteriaceae bacterium]
MYCLKKNLLFSLFLLSVSLSAQTTRKYSNEFMNIGVDAAAFGMGNAVVASTGDVNSGYWNPAGLLKLEDKQISLMHAAYFANIANYDYAAFAMPLDKESVVALSVIRFGVDDILNTTQLIDDQGNIDYNRISLFSTADYGVTFSYARALPLDGLHLGVNAKVIRRIIGDFAASWGFGLDAALQFETKSNWRFGVMARDITTTFNTWNINEEKFADIQGAVEGQNQELPETTEITLPKLQLGISKSWLFHYDFSLLTEVDFNFRFAETNDIFSSSFASMTPSAGIEFGYIDLVFVRVGAGNFQNSIQLDGSDALGFQPNIGVGFKYKGIQVDYALTDIGDQSAALYSNVFSLKLDWSLFR